MTASLDEYRAVMVALDRIEGSAIVGGPLPMGHRPKLLTAEIRERVEMLRDEVEDMLFADSGGTRLGFESEKGHAEASDQSPASGARAGVRAAILASDEPTKTLAERLRISLSAIARIRREAGDRCAFQSGSGLSAEQRDEIATSAEPARVLATRHRVAESLVNKIRKSGRQGGICAPATEQI